MYYNKSGNKNFYINIPIKWSWITLGQNPYICYFITNSKLWYLSINLIWIILGFMLIIKIYQNFKASLSIITNYYKLILMYEK